VSPCNPVLLFEHLWNVLDDVMGGAATATIVRRAVRQATARAPDLGEFSITRDGFAYSYILPAAWRDDPVAWLPSLHALAGQLQLLLVELTGPVVVHRLRATPELQRCGLFAEVAR
jgi:hypothetical protein